MLSGVLQLQSEHYSSSGRLAEYKRQFRRAFLRPDDDPSIFAIELEMLAQRAFADIDSSIRRHLDSFGPDTPMRDIVDSCQVWESHNEAAVRCDGGSDRNSPQAVYQVTQDSQSPVVSTDSTTLDEVMRRLLPTPTVPPLKAAPILSDRELLIQRLLGAIRPPQPVMQEQSKLTDIEIMLQNMLPVGSVMEEDVSSSEPIPESLEGCFSCGELTRETDQCQVLDESLPFLPVGWQADRIGDEFILRPGPTGPPSQQAGNVD